MKISQQKIQELIDQLDPCGIPQIRSIYQARNQVTKRRKKLGIFSGSFNPMTISHVEMIDAAQYRFKLDEVLLVLAKANVDKEIFGLSLAKRLITLSYYAENRDNFSVAVSSHGRYIEKVEALKSVFPSGTEFCFIVGYDTFVRIFDYKYYADMYAELDQLFGQCRLIVANRDNHDAKAIRDFLSFPDRQVYADKIDLIGLSDFHAGVSSTDIRSRLENSQSISDLVPAEITQLVIDYYQETINQSQIQRP